MKLAEVVTDQMGHPVYQSLQTLLQKGSPYLEDVDNLIDLAAQAGLIDASIRRALPNGTKCNTWQDVRASHMADGHKIVVTFEDVYGMMGLLGFCSVASLVAFAVEKMITRGQ